MRTAVVSDLHLGVSSRRDLARGGAPRDRLLGALEGAERVVLLGDTVELRERPLAEALEGVRPFFVALGEALAGRRVVLAPGNHDHGLGGPWLARLRLDGAALESQGEWPVAPGDGAAGRIASWMPEVELSLAYPGLWLRPGVYATHGHYLDVHLTVPRLESIAASFMGLLTGRGRSCASAAEYEAVLGPMYAFHGELAQGSARRMFARGGHVSRDVWQRVNGSADGRLGAAAGRFLIGSVTIPAAVLALNRIGMGPFSAELTAVELRRSGLLAMGRVADTLAPAAEHVIFGHTHRPGPLPGDEQPEWTTLRGARLWNSGSWFLESVLTRGSRDSPYWPGTVLSVDDHGPPRIENAMRDLELAA
ncbi:MAG TPA: metallophosphoesterase [Thermoleophilaceae bacterium]|nr:metallophosphoesterase [Thermoleophilaceae bacterium]